MSVHIGSEADPQFTMLEETVSLPKREHLAGFMCTNLHETEGVRGTQQVGRCS